MTSEQTIEIIWDKLSMHDLAMPATRGWGGGGLLMNSPVALSVADTMDTKDVFTGKEYAMAQE